MPTTAAITPTTKNSVPPNALWNVHNASVMRANDKAGIDEFIDAMAAAWRRACSCLAHLEQHPAVLVEARCIDDRGLADRSETADALGVGAEDEDPSVGLEVRRGRLARRRRSTCSRRRLRRCWRPTATRLATATPSISEPWWSVSSIPDIESSRLTGRGDGTVRLPAMNVTV